MHLMFEDWLFITGTVCLFGGALVACALLWRR